MVIRLLLLLLLLCTQRRTKISYEKEEESHVVWSMELQPYQARNVTTPVYVCVCV